ncbi:MFS transporter [Thalassococcus sp. CAU 1522]|uniref:MFS transporter n=1 Tax=Thalassococcus arenae TaxID=2851652 RepID=A0ABS6N2T2_9RHOB|nr:MFS transporter [Thalassococcus arenae]MBV2358331.1 MFS transporter [Thalassococcus arenae]
MPGLGAQDVYEALTETGAEADAREARNGLRHVASLSMTKVADGLIDPKLVLSWLSGALGAPAAITGLLVPIREAGALLPQLLLAGWVRGLRHRKWAWVLGSVGQGIAAAAICVIALTLEGPAAGLALCAAVGMLALSRAAASVSYKDVLGKTVAETRRGTVTGAAGTASALAVLAFAALLLSGYVQAVGVVVAAIGLAACLWLVAAMLFSRLEEDKSEAEAASALDLAPLRDDAQFRHFILTRGALTVTALAPPYFVLLGGGQSALQGLGALVLASAAASFASSYVWGRLADVSSRRVLCWAGFGGGAAMTAAVLADTLGWTAQVWVTPALLFALMIAYHGVRQGRSTYLVDMAPDDARSSYAALANTAIGTLLLVSGAFGGALATLGPVAALSGFALLSALGGLLALGLDEAQGS